MKQNELDMYCKINYLESEVAKLNNVLDNIVKDINANTDIADINMNDIEFDIQSKRNFNLCFVLYCANFIFSIFLFLILTFEK